LHWLRWFWNLLKERRFLLSIFSFFSFIYIATISYLSNEVKKINQNSLKDNQNSDRESDTYEETNYEGGFQNLGNTCYLNSSLQCLLHIPNFVLFLEQCPENNSFCSLLLRLISNPKSIKSVVEELELNGEDIRDQRDPGDFIEQILLPRLGQSVVSLLFWKMEDPEDEEAGIFKQLQLTIANPSEPERMEQLVQKFKTSQNSFRFTNVPPIAVIRIQYKKEQENFNLLDVKDVDFAPLHEQNASLPYTLRGIVTHHGTSWNSGHYTCIVQVEESCWVFYNDSHKKNLTYQEVIDYMKGTRPVMLFFAANLLEE